ncbi:F-box protein CPR1-like [Cornus florida]|uniref:F-box protein CPR1-like n=1 Tax=Cornus florida TaxID=4283 RepID=UPI00289B554B|nr:F-box protein CPR1-like [Cornus florida]
MATCNEIPKDVIIEILLMLPVKSLIRARVVCKNWYSIIINPSFVTKHLNHHANSGRLFVNRYDKISHKYTFSLFPDQTLAGSPPVCQDVVVDMPYHLVANLFNGILCLCDPSYRFALWNPATREFRSLPELSPNFLPDMVSGQETYGFGFDPITNDYKVVWIWNTWDPCKEINSPYEAAVYTLSTDSWRYLDHVALPYPIIDTPLSNTCINRVYHWFAMDNDRHALILSFDMGNELFHEISHITRYSKHAVLAAYNNSLALINYDSFSTVDIWAMMEEGCWTKQSTLQLPDFIEGLLGFWTNGQIFMESEGGDSHVALYDLETREIKKFASEIWAECLVYRESLVSIRGRDGFLEHDQLSDVDKVLNFCE